MGYGKSIELFLANGTADSLIIAELSNWNGKASGPMTWKNANGLSLKEIESAKNN